MVLLRTRSTEVCTDIGRIPIQLGLFALTITTCPDLISEIAGGKTANVTHLMYFTIAEYCAHHSSGQINLSECDGCPEHSNYSNISVAIESLTNVGWGGSNITLLL